MTAINQGWKGHTHTHTNVHRHTCTIHTGQKTHRTLSRLPMRFIRKWGRIGSTKHQQPFLELGAQYISAPKSFSWVQIASFRVMSLLFLPAWPCVFNQKQLLHPTYHNKYPKVIRWREARELTLLHSLAHSRFKIQRASFACETYV